MESPLGYYQGSIQVLRIRVIARPVWGTVRRHGYQGVYNNNNKDNKNNHKDNNNKDNKDDNNNENDNNNGNEGSRLRVSSFGASIWG